MSLVDKLRGIAFGGMAAFLLTYSLHRQLRSARFWLLFAGIALTLIVVIRLVMKHWFESLDDDRCDLDPRIEALTPEKARRRASELLRDLSHYRTTARITPNSENLHPTLREIFDDFEVVTDTTGNRLSIGVRTSEFIQVGSLHDGVRLLARLSDGGIFEVWPDQSGPQLDPDFPSLSHWLVMNAGD